MDLNQNKIQAAPGAPRINQAVTADRVPGKRVQGRYGAGGDVPGHFVRRGDVNARFGAVGGVGDREGRYSLITVSSLKGDPGLVDTRKSTGLQDARKSTGKSAGLPDII